MGQFLPTAGMGWVNWLLPGENSGRRRPKQAICISCWLWQLLWYKPSSQRTSLAASLSAWWHKLPCIYCTQVLRSGISLFDWRRSSACVSITYLLWLKAHTDLPLCKGFEVRNIHWPRLLPPIFGAALAAQGLSGPKGSLLGVHPLAPFLPFRPYRGSMAQLG